MIQRIQTIWLFLASATIFALFLFPYLQYADLAGMGQALKVTGKYRGFEGQAIREEWFLLQTIATVILGIFPLHIVVPYTQRKLQVQLIGLELVLVLLVGFWLYSSARTARSEAWQFLAPRTIGVGFVLLPIAIFFLLVAMGGVRKDEI